MNKRKIIKTMLLTVVITMLSSISAFAGTWQSDAKGWWYQKSNGNYPSDTWQEIDHNWYFFNSEGYMQTGWIQSENQWYYCNLNGILQTGWIQTAGKWYYCNNEGSLVTNQWIDGTYYVGDDGAMYVDTTTPEGIYVDHDGKKTNSNEDYSCFIGEYMDCLDDTGAGWGAVQYLTIDSIKDGKIYGKFDAGYTELYREDFSMGVKLSGNRFVTNGVAEFWEKGDKKPYKTEKYTAEYKLVIRDGSPVVVKNNETDFYLKKR